MSKANYIGYWLIIAIMVSMGYIYQGEIKNFGNLFLANLIPGYIIEKGSKEIEVAAGENGHFFINAEVNGQKVKFLVDTGASSISIGPGLAKKIGIDMKKLEYNQVYQTANGRASGAFAKVRSLQIGGHVWYDLYVTVSKVPLGTPLLGMEFLKKLKSYSVKNNRLHLYF